MGALWNRFGPSSKIFLMTNPRRCFFVGHLCHFSLFCYAFVCVCSLMPCGHLLGKGCPPGSRLWCLIVQLSLSHCSPGSGKVLSCVNSWSLPSFLLNFYCSHKISVYFIYPPRFGYFSPHKCFMWVHNDGINKRIIINSTYMWTMTAKYLNFKILMQNAQNEPVELEHLYLSNVLL